MTSADSGHIVCVDLGERTYSIHVRGGALDLLSTVAAERCGDGTVLVVTDTRVDALYGPRVAGLVTGPGLRVHSVAVTPGERSKSYTWLRRLHDAMARERLSRESLVIALGGGVVGDLAGFAAATYMRGVPVVQVPTTLLAMVDSSVGGKAAINHPAGKNLIGAFWQPCAVVCDSEVLRSLPPREVRAGLAEAIKHGVIADVDYLTMIESRLERILAGDADVLSDVVSGSCRIKADVVSADEREAGLRRILNYGHTFAHAFEKLLGYRGWRHGEAVAVGMVCAGRLSVSLGLLPDDEARRAEALIQAAGLPTTIRDLGRDAVVSAMRLDKKATGRGLRLVVSHGLGRAGVVESPSPRLVAEACASVLV